MIFRIYSRRVNLVICQSPTFFMRSFLNYYYLSYFLSRIVKVSAKRRSIKNIAIVCYIICHGVITISQFVANQTFDVWTVWNMRFDPDGMKVFCVTVYTDVMRLNTRWVFHQRRYSIKQTFWKIEEFRRKMWLFYMFIIKVPFIGAKRRNNWLV